MALWSWYTRDTALHSYFLVIFLITLPFSAFGSYVVYQLQIVGFQIGTDGAGGPCIDYCIVEWAGSQLDVNSVILYLNAFGFGLGGVVTLILCAYADFWSAKSLLITLAIVIFGAITAPVYWLQDVTQRSFNALSALSILFSIVTLILLALLNIYIPYYMRTKAQEDVAPTASHESTKRKHGFKMSTFANLGNGAGGILIFIMVIILTKTLPPDAAQSSGLIVTTVTGFITLASSLVAFFGLPAVPGREYGKKGWLQPAIEFFQPLRELLIHKNMAALLVCYTIYTDSFFALGTVTSQLFVLELQPSTLDVSLYFLTQYILLLATSAAFLITRPYLPLKLEVWLLIGYALALVTPIWGSIGLADVPFGFKFKWEFYVQLFIASLSGAFVNITFRVLLAEMVPKGSEIRWFGMQLVLSCATVWVNYVASAPLQNATHQLRFPLIISLVFLLFAFGLDIARNTLQVFADDKKRWADENLVEVAEDGQSEEVTEQSAAVSIKQ